MLVQLSGYGNGLWLRLPEEMAARLGVGEGSWLELSLEPRRIAVSPAPPRYTLEELLAGTTPEALRDAFDWGDDLGRERVAE